MSFNAILIECYVNKQTERQVKFSFTTEYIDIAKIS